MKNPKISILILTYNAPMYVYKTIRSLKNTDYDNFEVIVFDNDSRYLTKLINLFCFSMRWIDRLVYSNKNILFSPGNNEAFKNISKDSQFVLLLNSDIEVKDSNWLHNLLKLHERGVVSYGLCVNEPIRADGFCFLVDKDLYEKYKLDESYEWWWGLTKFQAVLLENENCKIKAVKNHDNMIVHFGGASRKGFFNAKNLKNAKGLNTDIEEVRRWFGNGRVEIIDSI